MEILRQRLTLTRSWFTSSRCDSGACVELATTAQAVLMRNSTDPHGPVLALPVATFRDFVEGVKRGEFVN